MKEIILLAGIIFLCLNVFRLILGNYIVLKSEYSIYSKIWNIIETIIVVYATVVLIINYY